MINRDLIRIKVLQLVYAYYQNENSRLDKAEKELNFSLSKGYELYNSLLFLMVCITKEMGKKIEIAENRAMREQTEMPSRRFIDNKFIKQLEVNNTLCNVVYEQNISWDNDFDLLNLLCRQIESSDIYNNYMYNGNGTYDEDRDLWRDIYKNYIKDSTELETCLEEKSLYWNDDKAIIDTFVLKTIRQFKEDSNEEQNILPKFKSEDDELFAKNLFKAAILNGEEYSSYISETSSNWDIERLAFMDKLIIQIAIAEMITFPSIPIAVTINEYVELSKVYSTPKSGAYINGMLDTIAHHLVNIGKVFKPIDNKKTEKIN